jgi:hypothetical protein
MARRESSNHDDTTPWSINGLRKSNWVPSAIPKKSPAIASRGARRPETFPKAATYCHLLPFWSRKTAKSVSTVSIHFLPFEGVPASLGPGLRTVSGAVRSLGAKLSDIRDVMVKGPSGLIADGHPEEDLMDALRGTIRDALPDGNALAPRLPRANASLIKLSANLSIT